MEIIAAADGSSLGNPGPAGWAWVTTEGAWRSGGWPRGTNNQGELMAVADLLEQTAGSGAALRILCDSQYVINSVTKWMPGWKRRGWKKSDGKPVLNRDLLARIDAALQGRDVEFEWVRGHAGHDLNEQADAYARAAATAYQCGREPDAGPGFGAGGGLGDAAGVTARAGAAGTSDTAPAGASDAMTRSAGDLATLFDFEADSDDELRAELARHERENDPGRRHPNAEQIGHATGEITGLRVELLGGNVALVRSRVGGAERTAVWQRLDDRHGGEWVLRLRHDS